ncbi:histone-lysine N-methyltransferase, H3 lysine-79 specific isoform X1 [Drosophila kikkawai]|uniref:Histone-lysine N-methyltransferase, H3 lysine-79 specific n=1 Tax=Drosophila kikkawai TaxID=30033 RepID=A0A6P4JA44_DROKI|nr:histone-lysine N-methyltransferase, H3 lysine-79 specific isoform X1 [Drosophila kikkawai]XP_017031463.1 histone-lysine N-methyltransferase, H3 lysine-79 specific isoform X1 [Drosophila kikkawai]
MATPQVKDLVLRSPAGSSDVISFAWPLQIGHGQDKHDNGIDIIDTIKFVCDELPSMSSAFEETNLNQIDTACYKTMTGLVDRFNKAVDSIVALEKGTSLPAERLNKFAHPSLLRHILQLVYNAAVLDPDKLNQYEPFSPEVYGETSYELVQQMLKHVTVGKEDTFIDLGSGVGQVVLQMAGSFPLKTCIGIEKADTPARYAERMDVFFRQYMGWFGKRYCEYKLIKGDFLVDEHREKITSSTLVFVNNFAFGPTVDHQLKERFADLRDGARVVSSKSFCPLNFRITDRNLSDIGTIMHVSEIPPLKGSVSWTCKPVSYYLHVIDRTILERYFQRLKTKGGNDHDSVGTVRTTRDRAKREANVGQHHHHNNNHHNNINNHANNNHQREREQSNGSINTAGQQQQQQRHQSQSPANVSGGGGLTVAIGHPAAASKTRQQQQQQQRSLDMESSTESDGEATNGNGGNTTTATNTTSASNGPMTRKVWSDWCSSKGKSSQSDDEENNNSNSNGGSNGGGTAGPGAGGAVGRQARAATQKKRKKLTRKAAIASKSAAAAQREAEAAAAAAAASAAMASKDSSSKEDQPRAASAGPGRKGRLKKGARGRKSLKIVGLEALHTQTVLSTSLDAMTKKLPAAPGTVDQQLTALLTENMAHTELDIPTAPQDTPYALQILLDVFRSQYMTMIEQMKSSAYVPQVQKQIAQEQERMARLKNRANQLDKQIKVLINDSVALLKVRMNELGIHGNSSNDLIAQAKEIVHRHKDLQHTVNRMRNEVTFYEGEQKHLLKNQLKNLPEYQKLCGGVNGKVKLEVPPELSETTAQELVLKEIANTLSQRKKLYAQVSTIEQETTALQKTAEERSTAATLLAQGTNMMTVPTTAASASSSSSSSSSTSSSTTTSTPLSNPITVPTNNKINNVKNSRRSREHRARSQEWPEVPEVGKIQESNPEVLAQKIVETCRQIEAGKFQGGAAVPAYQVNGKNKVILEAQSQPPQAPPAAPAMSIKSSPGHHYKDSTLMPAPKQQQQQVTTPSSLLPKCELPGLSAGSRKQESPKVANFEDRLKSIITTALNEDQEQRSKAVDPIPSPSPLHSPAPKRSKQQQPGGGALNPTQSLHNIITVSTQGLMHLNANTTISPITPPLPGPGAGATASTAPPPPANLPYGAYGGAVGKVPGSSKYQQAAKEPKYAPPPPPPPPSSHMAALYSAGQQQTSTPADLAYQQRRRSSVSASSYEHFMVQQQQHQQQHALMLAAAAHAAQRQQMRVEEQQQQQHHHQQQQQQHHHHHQQQQQHLQQHRLQHQHLQHHHHHHPNEFKAPPADNLLLQRSSSREQLIVEPQQQQQPLELLPRASSANSDYGGYRIRPPSRPSSNSSQPDYTQVSPAKMALRRHLSQEKLSQHATPQATPPPPPPGQGGVTTAGTSGKTIGDLVNGEIERTLEISHQSIINAAVNMSTGGAHFMERTTFLNDRSNDQRLLINLNAQRPERVHVRPLSDESQEPHPTSYAQERGAGPQAASGGNSNLATLAHVAYVQKAQAGGGRANVGTAPPPASSHSSSARSGRDYQPVALPRAELKGSIEAYFHEEQQQQQQKQSKGSGSTGAAALRGTRLNGANPPLEGLAASLQDHVRARKYKEETEERQRRAAAAASSSSSAGVPPSGLEMAAHYAHQAPPAHSYHHHHHHHGASLNGTPHKVELGVKRSSPLAPHQQPPRPSKLAHYEPPPPQHHQAHLYANGQVLPPPPPAHDATTPSPTPSSSSSSCGRRSNSNNNGKMLVDPPLLMSPEINSLMGDERPLQLSHHSQQQQQQQMLHHHQSQQQQHHQQQLQQLRVPHLGHGHGHGHSTTPTLGGQRSNANAADDDDVIAADDESHWQHRVSSGFDRLVAFASTELDKTRRSIDGIDTVPASISCNTSPDSGITHSSSNSDAVRTFLSTSSSSSSQLELPIGSGGSSSNNSLYNSGGNNGAVSHQQQQQQQQLLQVQQQQQQHQHLTTDHLSDSSSIKSSASSSLHGAGSSSLKTVSPVDPSAIESPPLSDVGLPRTPSPSAASVATPPLASGPALSGGDVAGIPLKYQRKSKSGSEKHYKKKFCERNWEYDCDELLAYSNSSAPPTAADAAGNGPQSLVDTATSGGIVAASAAAAPLQLGKSGKSPKEKLSPHHNSGYNHHHKSSKFRPKGKDWDWSMDSRSQTGDHMLPQNINNSTTTTTSN